MPSSTSNFERVIPTRPWRGITVSVVMMLAVATVAWEIYCRSLGYGPSLNDTGDLWAEARRRVEPDSLVIIGDSRALFDSDLDELEKGLGKRPVQLAQPGSTVVSRPGRFDQRQSFHGTIICSVVPRLFFAPPGSPPMNRERKIGAPLTHPDVCPTSEPRSRHLSREMVRLHEAGRPDARRAARSVADSESAQRPGATAAAALFCLARSRAPRPHGRTMRAAGKIAGTGEASLGSALHSAATSELCPEGSLREKNARRLRSPLRRHQGPRRKTAGARRQNRFRALSDERRSQSTRRPDDAASTDLGSPPQGNRRAGHLLRGLSRSWPDFTCPEWSHLSAGDSVEFTKRLVPHLRAALDAGSVASAR